jgi:Asp-tRNA(Asn)/Glu-tRNA(Gln) amidotransferase A subunit family amidase
MPLAEQVRRAQERYTLWEPNIRAFLPEEGRFDRLRREASGLVDRFPRRDDRPPLFGILVGVKDVIHVEGTVTRAGSRLPPELLQGVEAECVTRLRAAGALILGKTTTSEFAYTAPTATRNPHNLEHSPGGSSSGSAAAVATGLCPLALGTQTTGSIIRPAAFCGVVGFKPTYDRVSRAGLVSLAPAIDHVGFLASDVKGVRAAASLLCREWRAGQDLRRLEVLGVPEGGYLERVSRQGLRHFRRTCRRLAEAGFQIRTVPAMPDFAAVEQIHDDLLAGEAARVHADWFAAYRGLYHPLTADMLTRGRHVSDAALARARESRRALRQTLSDLMDAYDLDLWISPSAPGPAPRGLEYTGDSIMNLPWTHSGLPTISLPASKTRAGLPLGLQVAGRWWADEEVLAWSEELEAILERSARGSPAAVGSVGD